MSPCENTLGMSFWKIRSERVGVPMTATNYKNIAFRNVQNQFHHRISSETSGLLFLFLFQYSINRSQLFTRSVLISVWHHGRLSRNAFLGEVEIPLDCRDLDSPYEDIVALMTKVDQNVFFISLPSYSMWKGSQLRAPNAFTFSEGFHSKM